MLKIAPSVKACPAFSAATPSRNKNARDLIFLALKNLTAVPEACLNCFAVTFACLPMPTSNKRWAFSPGAKCKYAVSLALARNSFLSKSELITPLTASSNSLQKPSK